VLSICKVAAGRAEYYLDTVATGREHSEGLVEAPGVWLGAGSAGLGLAGIAEPDAVRMLFGGVDPVIGDLLLDHPGRRRIAAYDCTFSTPKSVSVMQAFSPDPETREQVRLSHEAAANASLAYLESEAPAVRFRTPDGSRVVRGGEMPAVGFLHRLSRAGDPHLHTHVLIANIVVDRTGGPGHPLDATSLFGSVRTAGALYETHLRFELTHRLGVEWQPLNGRCWSDLKGLDRPMIDRLSRRSTQIGAAVEAEGWQGPAARRAMADLTRPPKDTSRSYDDVISDAQVLLRKAGVSDARLRNVCHRVPTGLAAGREDDVRWREEALQRLAERTVNGTFTVRDVIGACCASAREGRSVGDVLNDARDLLSDERVISRGDQGVWLRGGATGSVPVGRREESFTTLDVAATEERIAVLGRSMMGDGPGELTVVAYRAGDRFEALDALSAAVTAWRAEGRNVIAVAPGRWPAAAIESACGMDTVVRPAARLAPRLTPGGWSRPAPADDIPIASGSVVVLAEAQCYGPAALEGFLSSCEAAGASVVLFGPRWALESRPALQEATAMTAALPAPLLDRRAPSGPVVAGQFGSVGVTMVPSLGAARDEAVRQLADGRGSGPAGGPVAAIVVTGDEAIVKALRSTPGVGAGEIAHTRDLKRVLEARAAGAESGPAPPKLIVVGGASVLRQGATAGPSTDRSHILVAPGVTAGSSTALGLAAEAARPRYLTSRLGVPPAGAPEREAWRAAAVVVEHYRDRWQVSDERHALGRGSPAVERGSERETHLAVVERLAVDVRGQGRHDRRRERGAPTLGLGR
jgi:conjugative relaxase-like TrwC/TraI family protein